MGLNHKEKNAIKLYLTFIVQILIYYPLHKHEIVFIIVIEFQDKKFETLNKKNINLSTTIFKD